jgi:hypothetical protein
VVLETITRKEATRRFWSCIDKSGRCWLWTGAKNGGGYGTVAGVLLRVFGEQLASRVSLALKLKRKLRLKEKALHACDTPACVKPAHLFPGTQKQNVADCVSKGRHSCGRGVRHDSAKLTERLVASIRKGPRAAKIWAKELEVSLSTIYAVRSGARWKHVATKGKTCSQS